ncbi:MAG: DUF359 domain-containing protein [Candidatus Micrarchaeota archaeon]|nr:DUF359 domain-containing protein [Candidatus Micrarchaeota archaeon]
MDEQLRKKLSKPYGPIYKKKSEVLKILQKKYRKLIAVGDKSSYFLLSLGIIPNIVIFDKKIERKPAPKKYLKLIFSKAKNLVKISNPPGTISFQLVKIFKKALKKKSPVFIEIEGEEDLATAVALVYCSQKDFVFYGQPKKGIVLLKINKTNKEFGKKVLKKLLQ